MKLGSIIAGTSLILATAFAFINITAMYAAFVSAAIGFIIIYLAQRELEKNTKYLTYEEAKKLGMFDQQEKSYENQ